MVQLSAASQPDLIGSKWAGVKSEKWMNSSQKSDDKIQDLPQHDIKATHWAG